MQEWTDLVRSDGAALDDIYREGIDGGNATRSRGRRHPVAGLPRLAELNGVWTIPSSVFPGNTAGQRLNAHAGFREVGARERVERSTTGPWAGQWRDTILIERRSTMNGCR